MAPLLKVSELRHPLWGAWLNLVTNILSYISFSGASSLDAAKQINYCCQDNVLTVKHLSALKNQDRRGRKIIPKHNSVIKAFTISPTSCLAESWKRNMKKQRLSQTQIFSPLTPAQDSNFFEVNCSLKTDNTLQTYKLTWSKLSTLHSNFYL